MRLLEGDRLRREGELEGALAHYRGVRDAHPESVPAHQRYVAALRALGRRSQAREEYRLRAAAPGASPADATLARALGGLGSSTDLRRAYQEASERDPASPWWPLALAEVELAEADAWNQRRLEEIERGDRDGETRAHAQARGALARAEPALTRAARLAPALAGPDLYRGHVRALEGDLLSGGVAQSAAYRAAADAFQRAVAVDPGSVEAWAGLGDVRSRLGESDDALRAWSEAARRAPADADARLAVAILLHQAGRHDEAVLAYREVATLRPAEGEPWIRMGDALADDERYEAALSAYAEALRREPDQLEVHARVGTVLEHQGRLGEARAAYQRYVDQGGTRSAEVNRRLERLLRAGVKR